MVCESTGIDTAQFNRLVNNTYNKNFNVGTLALLSSFFQVSTDYLLFGKNTPFIDKIKVNDKNDALLYSTALAESEFFTICYMDTPFGKEAVYLETTDASLMKYLLNIKKVTEGIASIKEESNSATDDSLYNQLKSMTLE